MNNRLLCGALALCTALLLPMSGCAVEKREKSVEDFEAAVTATSYTLYVDNEDYEGQGFQVEQAVVALSEDEENRMEFFRCVDEAAARRLYESFGTDILAACNVSEHPHEKEFLGDNYECHGALCDGTYYYRVRVGSTLLWATGSEEGREQISEVVRDLDY